MFVPSLSLGTSLVVFDLKTQQNALLSAGEETYLSLGYGTTMSKLLNKPKPQPAKPIDKLLATAKKKHAEWDVSRRKAARKRSRGEEEGGWEESGEESGEED